MIETDRLACKVSHMSNKSSPLFTGRSENIIFYFERHSSLHGLAALKYLSDMHFLLETNQLPMFLDFKSDDGNLKNTLCFLGS